MTKIYIKAKQWDEKLSDHFSLREFRCPCELTSCTVTKVDLSLIELLEIIRLALGIPLKITSGYRCPEHNASIDKSAPKSQHIEGKAADVLIPDHKHYLVEAMVGDKGGFGRYDDRVHVDTRGSKARWDFRSHRKIA